tara:strand:- start:27 stop:740 length:714 start_codon:yes stop_codon:yes gene_type:complete
MSKAKKIDRDNQGLLKGVDYKFTDEGLIDWRKMLSDKWLYPNPSKNLSTQDVSKLKDTDLCILLGGIKELAQIRGYTNIKYDVTCPSPDYVIANCTITWVPNFETEDKEVSFSSLGDASPNNTDNFARQYLAPIAENRAFVRCVRNFLRINIVAQDELAKRFKDGNFQVSTPQQAEVASPTALLEKLMKEKGVDFQRVKNRLIRQKYKDADKIESIKEIPALKIFELIEDLNKVKTT